MGPSAVTEELAAIGLEPGAMVGVALWPEVGLGVATASGSRAIAAADPVATMAAIDRDVRPRWVWWDRATAAVLAAGGLGVGRCWDVVAVQRHIEGRFRVSIATTWAAHNDLDPAWLPTMGQLDLLNPDGEGGDPENPVRPDGYLRPEWLDGGWRRSPERLERWARLTQEVAQRQGRVLDDLPDPRRARSTAHSESAAELLCAELALHGLPIDEDEAARIIIDAAGPRPTSWSDEDGSQRRRDDEVLRHLDPPQPVNLRNPADVKAMLRRNGYDLPDTRAWRLEELRDTDPLIDALLTWRKAERIATTYGWTWLDEHVSGGRLRGEWSSSDGAAGRMTASAGLHNLPAPMRPAVAAEAGYRLVRADLGQIEPRVLAAVSGDRALIAATGSDDLYRPVADRLGVERDIAKVAVLGAMYGSTTGQSAGALRGLERSYPVAMAFLEEAAKAGQRGQDLFTVGGRRLRLGGGSPSASATDADDGIAPAPSLDRAAAAAAARGRYARNAVIQGAAAEFFKVWAVIVRRRVADHGARVVLCLHDELLVHTPSHRAAVVADLVTEAVAEAAFYWSPEPAVRYVTETTVIDRWSDAKD